MNKSEAYQKDIESIRHLMERSVKFISLSGLSGILAGVYALAGACAAYFLVFHSETTDSEIVYLLMGIALAVLAASLITGFWLSGRKARKSGIKLWDATSRRLTFNLAIPLVTGGLFILILLINGHYGVIAPSFLIFYGLALINASPNLYDEVRYLGYSEVLLGLLCAFLPGYGLIFWAVGFGLFHILYGAVMYKKYDA
jgi:hypothetical protein